MGKFFGLAVVLIMFNVVFWAIVIYVALHFIGKFW